ncbi:MULTISPECIES: hypothetical protein [unclassified Morganella (in: enterobacteria)]|uniref:hypothetical protein n=1 Tax=unclassified Morganella (in: enterobacteria) TaxID=2676694 RepID=UPI0029432EA4|nr:MULTISPECIES: hypothetical protein [unclassified Morganella (in: enterobacteria)]
MQQKYYMANSMEFKGTPAPWTHSGSRGLNETIGGSIHGGGNTLCVVMGKRIGKEQATANAKLMAAAPELLSALQGIQQSMAKYINIANNIGMDVTADGFYLGHAMEVEEQARAAINKALGRE